MSPPPRCLSCDRVAADAFGLCAHCGGRTLVLARTGDYGVQMPEVASAQFRRDTVKVASDFLPGLDEDALDEGLRKGRVRLVEGLSRPLAEALIIRFADVPVRGELVQGEARGGLGKLAHPLPLALGAVVAGAAYAAFPALIALDLAGGGAIALGGAAYLALRKGRPLVALDAENDLPEALRSRTTPICDRSADLEPADRLAVARTLAAAGAVYRVLERDDILGMSARGGSGDGFMNTLDRLLDELWHVVQRLAASGTRTAAARSALQQLQSTAEKAQAEVDAARKTLAGGDLQTQIEEELELVRETTAAVSAALGVGDAPQSG